MTIQNEKVVIVGGIAGLSCARHLHAAGIRVCGEYGSLPGIQWALVSGRRAAEVVIGDLR